MLHPHFSNGAAAMLTFLHLKFLSKGKVGPLLICYCINKPITFFMEIIKRWIFSTVKPFVQQKAFKLCHWFPLKKNLTYIPKPFIQKYVLFKYDVAQQIRRVLNHSPFIWISVIFVWRCHLYGSKIVVRWRDVTVEKPGRVTGHIF